MTPPRRSHPRKPASATAAAQPQAISPVDLAWLRMDNAVNRMVILGVWRLDAVLSIRQVQARVAERLAPYPRFRCKAVIDSDGAHWVPDADFDIARHVVPQPLPADPRGPEAALKALCGELAAQALDPSRPLWCFHLVDDVGGGGSALVARIHHGIADGIALIGVMNALTDAPAAQQTVAANKPPAQSVIPTTTAQWLQGALNWRRVGAQAAGRLLGDLGALALMPEDSRTLLKRQPMGRKAVAWCEPLPLDEVKAVARAFGASVNDVLLAAAAGAIGAWLESQGESPAGKAIRAMVPVNLRAPGQEAELGNRFGLAPLLLPIGLANPVERLYAVRARMAELKGSSQPMLAFAVLAATGLLARPMQEAAIDLFSRKATAVMTNVPGPTEPLRFCGATIRQTLFWVPSAGDIGVGVSILSYAGGVQFGLITDRGLCAEPQTMVDRFAPEFDQLLWLALQLPWAGQPAA